MFHAGYDSIEITVTREDDKGRVGFSGLDGGFLFNVSVLGDALLVRRMRFRAGKLFSYVGEGCCTAIFLMGEAEDEVQTDLRVL